MHEALHAMERAYDTLIDDEDEEIRNHKVEIFAQAFISFIRLNKRFIEIVQNSYEELNKK
jgi:hypothetical protein